MFDLYPAELIQQQDEILRRIRAERFNQKLAPSHELPELQRAEAAHNGDIQRAGQDLAHQEVPGMQLDIHQPRDDRGRRFDSTQHPEFQAQAKKPGALRSAIVMVAAAIGRSMK